MWAAAVIRSHGKGFSRTYRAFERECASAPLVVPAERYLQLEKHRKDARFLSRATLLTLPQIADAVGVEYRTLHSWVRRGLVEPSLQKSRGTGFPNLFSREDAVKAKVIAELRQAGLSFDLLTRAATGLDDYPAALIDGAMVLVNGTVTVVDTTVAIETIKTEALTLVYNTRSAIESVGATLDGEQDGN